MILYPKQISGYAPVTDPFPSVGYCDADELICCWCRSGRGKMSETSTPGRDVAHGDADTEDNDELEVGSLYTKFFRFTAFD